ncbi:RHS repeat-associated core domain-containing protein [Pseudomonas helleri]|uniref:RHS repeat protein n=4 Tax=Pseudomonas helleri TaxID=1608996 RepID=A0A7X1WZV4_9PSED|nr:RHS repeat-associated core domain-containing protein [Pseudomonas helleri]MQT77836.1 RHS repeat protein [Pseudomonas helleri]
MSLHQNTPTLTVSDPRGLVVRTVSWHRSATQDTVQARNTLQRYDAIGRLNQQCDPRLFELSDLANQSTRYSLSGQVLLSESVDAGWRLACHDAAGQLRDSWDGRDTHRRFTYDELMRPVNVFEHEPPLCVERFTYAGADEEAARHNRCGQLLRHDDQAGSLWHDAFALTGQPQSEARQFCTTLTPPHWPASEADLEDTTYTTRWQHDALGAVIEQIDALEHVQRFEFDVAGQPFASWLDDVALLKSTTYNALGRVEIELAGNDVTTTAYYSARDGLLSNLKAKRSDGKTLQDLHYQYDPVGNITRIEDLAQPVQWFTGQRIQAVSTFTYDTLYQLISATGRENASQTIGPNLPGLEIFGSVDDSRWRTYSQTYSYDSGGNLTRLKHAAGAGNSYTREMVVDARSNRSLFKDGSPLDFAKAFDANGNLQALAPGQLMQWDSRNQLQHVTQVQREDPDGQDDDTETYVYDGDGQRVRKVRRAKTRGGEHISEVRYLPGLEIRSRTSGEQLHVVLAQAGRNAVRLLNRENGQHQHRYSVNDHLGSSTLELNQSGEVLSQESYYPYGGTAWWAAKNALEARYKVIRYSGKERDATGLYYYGFRYYAPWLQRWINPDPAGDVDGLNVFCMVRNNPVSCSDTDGRMLRAANQAFANESDEPEVNAQDHMSNVLAFSLLTQLSPEDDSDERGSENATVDFFRVDLAPPSEVLAQGFQGNNTERVLKYFGDDTIFVAQDLEGIDAFRAEVSNKSENMFGEARKYYFEMKLVGGYFKEVPRPLYLYKISIPEHHPHKVLSSAVNEDGFIEAAFIATYGEGDVAMLKENSEELYELNIENFKSVLEGYALSFNVTKEVQMKGPIKPEFITHINPGEEVFMRMNAVRPKRAA